MGRKAKDKSGLFIVKRAYAGSYIVSYKGKQYEVNYYEVNKGMGLSNYWGWIPKGKLNNQGYPEDSYNTKYQAIEALKNHLGIKG